MKSIENGWRLGVWAGALLAMAAGGCMSWEPGWQDSAGVSSPPGEANVDGLRDAADERFEAAASRDGVLAAIAAYRTVLAACPDDYRAMTRLGEAHVLLGAAYSPNGSAKARAYRDGIRWCERAMATNLEFGRLAREGGIDAAATALTMREYDAAFFWVTAVSYYFKECLRGPSVVFHLGWMKQTRTMLERLSALDPDWGPGMVQFSLSIYYLGMPQRFGGDMAESARRLERAIVLAPDSLLMRWGRAKYYWRKTGNRDGFRDDLEWVMARDPDRAGSPRRWNLYFQADAGAMLARIDDWFPPTGVR